jgi:hypothetical protein
MKNTKHNKFWHLYKTGRDRADWDDGMDLEQILCPVNPGHRRGGERTTNLRIVLSGNTIADVEDFIWLHECVIQDHVLQLFRENGVTGFEVKPVKARFEEGNNSPPILWEIVTTGWAGVAPPESGITLNKEDSCTACGMLTYTKAKDYSKLINPEQWDGSDIFIVWPLPRYIFITDRLRKLIQAHNLSGCIFIEPKDLPFSQFDSGFSPGRLSNYMPEKRANELGQPLGIY